MKILFLFSSLCDLTKPDIYSDIIVEAASKGNDVSVVSPRQEGQELGLHKENGITIARFNCNQLAGNKSYIKKGIAYLKLLYQYPKAMRKFFKNESFDLIVANSLPLEIGLVLLCLKRRYKANVFVLLCDFLWQDLVSLKILNKRNPIIWYYRLLERILFKSADYIGGLSQAYIDMAIKYHPFVKYKRLAIIFPWASEQHIVTKSKEILQEYGLDNKFIAIYGGNIGVAQDIHNIINLAIACQDFEDIVFVILGKGALLEKIKKVISNNITNIKFIDFLPKEKYLQLLSACDVGLISLNKKLGAPNFPSKTASLFNLSIPVLAAIDYVTDFGQYLDKYNMGLWSYSGDTNRFKHNLINLYENAELRNTMANNAYQFYFQNMKPSIAYQKIIDLVNS